MPFILALPEVDAVLMALIAAVFLLGFEPTRRLIRGILSALPVIGSTLARTADDLLTKAWADIASWLNSLVDGVDGLISSLWQPVSSLITSVEFVFESVFFKLSYILTTALPAAIGWLAGAVQTLVAGVRTELLDAISTLATQAFTALEGLGAEIVNVYNVLSAAITSAFNAAEHALSVAANDVVAWAYQAITELTQSIYSTVADVVSWATGTFANLETWAMTAINDAIAWTANEIATVEGLLQTGLSDLQKWVTALWTTAISAPLSVIWDAVQRPANQVVTEIATEYPDIAAQLRGISTTVPADVAAAITSTAAITIPITEWMNRCGMPLCKNLSGFGNDLKELETIIGSGAFLAFVAAAVADPKGTANVFHSVVDDVAKPFIDDVKAAI